MISKRNSGALVAGAILIAIGLLSLFGQLFSGFSFWSYLWPLMIIGIGGMFFIGMFAGGKSAAGLAIPGSILTCIGLMMFFQNLANHWESWAYGWTIILFSVGLGIFIMGLYTEDAQRRQSGLRVMRTGAILFIIFAGFFEGLIFSAFRGNGIQPYIFPILLILLGAYLVIARSGLLSSRRSETNDQPANLPEENK
jgi:hypothetical protein